ncbi:PilZ domain-containing protein [Desulfospira joergensenii]|uniref:PilZ domain-containing protein n=1 Tax=Desulfospira joergensenii TaxID=53329 RepID=UPI0003B33A8A|nr:PilZ domain-containing protein [Desulfospira joergensenii]
MTIPRVFVTSTFTATFSCSDCGKSYQKDVSPFIGHEAEVKLKYKCKCGHSFSVILERRRSIRKERSFKGHIIQNQKKWHGVVTDLSKHGLKFKVLEKSDIKVKRSAEVRFVLDNPNGSKITRIVKIKRAFSPLVFGCEFVDDVHYDDLGKYFLFNF